MFKKQSFLSISMFTEPALFAGPFKNFPQITVYHPQPGNGYSFANIGWTGWIGSITG